MSKFVEPPRTGKVMGNEVQARPVPFERLRAVQSAGASGDGLGAVDEMIGVVREYVTMADGSPIDVAELSGAAIQKLYLFATDMNAGGAADFT